MKRLAFVALSIIMISFLNYTIGAICDRFYFVEGFQCLEPQIFDIVFLSLIVIVPSFFLPTDDGGETMVLWYVYFFHIMSAVSGILYLSQINSDYYIFTLFFVVTFTIGSRIIANLQSRFVVVNLDIKTVEYGAVAVSALALATLLTVFSITFILPSITDVYGVRSEYKAAIETTSVRILSYLPIWSGYVFAVVCIFLATISYFRGRTVLALGIFALAATHSLAVFSLAAYKSVAFIFLIVLVLLFVLSRSKSPLLTFLCGLLGVGIFALLIAAAGFNDDGYYHWVRRSMIAPGMNVAYHLELFGLWNSQSYPDAPRLVSETFYGTSGSANTGMLGAGIGRGGLLGVAMQMLVFFVFLAVLKIATRNVPPAFSMALCLPTAYAFTNSSATTTLVTYGAAFIAIFLFLWGSALATRSRTLLLRSGTGSDRYFGNWIQTRVPGR
ncbi:hypothetical protein B7H23_14635 [Notoacmeibacter marinus]|uniref:Uncharacterized protein n=1 Tax=Notoacmeibacter marinus TaxID=1876515 RepID=A0A231UTY2_9HYPH|nr:hypothetical protein [Notoacmeibacter marinus]OXS99394.1 hypothetical protein B7H23_14635 [Notoacmeibacter marinus]